MAQKTLELKLISAKDLNNVNLISRMEVYAIVSVGDPRTQQRVATDRDGGNSPAWNATLRFPLDPYRAGAGSGGGTIHVLLRTERALGDRDVGEVHIPLSEIFDGVNGSSAPQFVSYQVRRPGSGKAKGVLNLSYKIIDPAYASPPPIAHPPPASKADPYPPPSAHPPHAPVNAYPSQQVPPVNSYAPAASAGYPPPAKSAETPANYAPAASAAHPSPAKSAKSDEPVTAYPAVAPTAYPPPAGYPQQGYPSYAPPLPHYGYGAQPPPPPNGYGYPQSGYGYQAVPAQRPNKNKFGMGLGAGLLGGAIGGMLLGDLVSDSSQDAAYDAGYDAGFDDGGGFGFDF